MSASSLLEQVQARPACLGHCVRREGARPGPGPSPPVGPSRAEPAPLTGRVSGLSGRPRPAPRPQPSLPASPRFSVPNARAAFPPQRASFSFLVPFRFPEARAPSRRPWRASPAFSPRPRRPSAFPASGFQAPAAATIPDAYPEACSFIPFPCPALMCLLFSISPSDNLLLGDVSFARRDQKVKETKVSPAPPVARSGGRGVVGAGSAGSAPGPGPFGSPRVRRCLTHT